MRVAQPDVQFPENWYLVTAGGKSSLRITHGLTVQTDEQGQFSLESSGYENPLIRFEVIDGEVWLSLRDPGWRLVSQHVPIAVPVLLTQATSLHLHDAIVHLTTDFSRIADRDVLDLKVERVPESTADLSRPFDDSIPILLDMVIEEPGATRSWPTSPFADICEVAFPEPEPMPQPVSAPGVFVPLRPSYLATRTPIPPGISGRRLTLLTAATLLMGLLVSPALLEPEIELDLRYLRDVSPAVGDRQPEATLQTTPPRAASTKELLVAVDALMEVHSPMDPVTLQFVVDAYRASAEELSDDLEKQRVQLLNPESAQTNPRKDD